MVKRAWLIILFLGEMLTATAMRVTTRDQKGAILAMFCL